MLMERHDWQAVTALPVHSIVCINAKLATFVERLDGDVAVIGYQAYEFLGDVFDLVVFLQLGDTGLGGLGFPAMI